MNKSFKRLSIVAVAIISTVALTDFCLGKVMNWILPQISNQGDTGKTYFSLNEVDTPIVVVGSSRAAHHYVSSMISDSLGYETYNVGRDGCFFSYNCCVINSILDRYSPKLIIWENSLDCLYELSDDPLESLHPYYGENPWVTECINEEYSISDIGCLFSNMYKYNSILHRIFFRYLKSENQVLNSLNGYDPLPPKESKLTLDILPVMDGSISTSKVKRLTAILSRAKQHGVKMVLVDSPIYARISSSGESKLILKNLCESFGSQFIDNTQHTIFIESSKYFNDKTHLNELGAPIYTEMFIKQITSI